MWSALKIFLDSTVLVDVERKKEDALDLVKNMVANDEELLISSVTISEILTGAYFRGEHKNLTDARMLFSQFTLVELGTKIADKIAQYSAILLRNGTPVDFKDVAIAATFAVTKSDFLLTQNK